MWSSNTKKKPDEVQDEVDYNPHPYNVRPSHNPTLFFYLRAVKIDLFDHLCRLLGIVYRSSAHDLVSDPGILLERVLLRSAPEDERLTDGLGKACFVLFLVARLLAAFLELVHLVRGLAHDQPTNLIEAVEPGLAEGVVH